MKAKTEDGAGQIAARIGAVAAEEVGFPSSSQPPPGQVAPLHRVDR